MGVRSEYRRKYDNLAAQTQDAWQEELAPTQPAQQPLPEPYQPEPRVAPHYANGNGQHPATAPWADKLEYTRALHKAANVQAPPSHNSDMGYSIPQTDPNKIRLSKDQVELCRKLDIEPATYARHLLTMEAMKKSGDLQQ